MKKREPREEGFTLIEVLAAVVILSVASMAMMAFFVNAMSYNKGNQNKTVMVNLARNALFYMEKQNFNNVENYFKKDIEFEGANPVISLKDCAFVQESGFLSCTSPDKQKYLNDFAGIGHVLRPSVNERDYEITVTYQQKSEKNDPKVNMSQYLIPIKVSIMQLGAAQGSREQIFVEGYVINEKIR
ncbi:hypothetical protein GCM10008018_38100 [Paenibacillus marchantiophytorum]|uniref:Prepilin-type N-terminal cleavage/methylation domain-containing protein n=1 Tax=Paenibacillus marchantiophytorum TaxID=1619310 RepID=A0ABQ1EUV5_9BACL|nr:type II secretion system protein [Paenibacillus marchantiophytorum]GFZ88322.1 hypothetical protein GCM10008018_38100 [Paenibacillus marchantiophytorum]